MEVLKGKSLAITANFWKRSVTRGADGKMRTAEALAISQSDPKI